MVYVAEPAAEIVKPQLPELNGFSLNLKKIDVKETLQMRQCDYLATYKGTQYLHDQHIKYGVSAQVLLRVYFCWDEALKKLIFGYLPGHLPTVKKGT